jgi:hypothetical protein
MLVSAACICAGLSRDAPAKDYSLSTSRSERTITSFLSVSILTSVFGNTPVKSVCRRILTLETSRGWW